ncbi:MAG: T9SS type A sorting domain-containing protein [Saprospiraceae bacterium]|nr:T9SS type A sorting domain-containing protein [Saprospiraceae bacterium]
MNSGVWVPTNLKTFAYYPNGDLQSEIYRTWRDTLNNWIKIEYSYNANLLSKREYYKWLNNTWMLIFHTDFIQEPNNWTNEMEFGFEIDSTYRLQNGKQYHCSNFNTSSKNSVKNKEPFLKYYNNKELYLQGDTYNINFEIFSLDGKRVNMGKLTESSYIIRIDQLQQGIYFLKFNNQIRPYQFIITDQ